MKKICILCNRISCQLLTHDLKHVETSYDAKFAMLSEINLQKLICAARKLSCTPVLARAVFRKSALIEATLMTPFL